ncbi:MAG: hypothetical protein K0U36_05215 [Alphaproteobacteria bacterium]|nr:hypothetical protein [Alphaproteobacteria bacterium]
MVSCCTLADAWLVISGGESHRSVGDGESHWSVGDGESHWLAAVLLFRSDPWRTPSPMRRQCWLSRWRQWV